MPVEREEFEALLLSMEAERIRNARFRRNVTDILAHLGDDNMPEIAERISALRKNSLSFHEGSENGPSERDLSVTVDEVHFKRREAEDHYTTKLSAAGLQCTYLYKHPIANMTDDLRRVYVTPNGTLVSVTDE